MTEKNQRQARLTESHAEYANKNGLQGQLLDEATREYRLSAAMMFCQGGMAFECVQKIENALNRMSGGRTLGGIRGLTDLVPFLLEREQLKVESIIKGCYPEFSTTVDGSPFFADAFAMKWRGVNEATWEIMEPLAACNLYENSLHSEQRAGEMLETLETKFELDMSNWMANMEDCCAVNHAAFEKMKERVFVNVLEVPCMAHGLNNAGSKMDGTTSSLILKRLTKMVQYSTCKARSLFKTEFGENPKKGGSSRWYNKHEHTVQTDNIGIGPIKENYVDMCVQRKYSDKSSRKLQLDLNNLSKNATGRVELAAIADGGKYLCPACYNSEGDAPLIFVVYGDIIQNLFNHLGGGATNYPFTRLKEATCTAANMMRSAQQPLNIAIEVAKTNLQKARDLEKARQEQLNLLLLEHQRPNVNDGRRGGRNQQQRNWNPSREYKEAEQALKDIEKLRKEAEERLVERENDRAAWQEGKLIAAEDFMNHGRAIACKGFKYFEDKFMMPGGTYYPIVQCYRAASIFDPTRAKDMSIQVIESHIDELVNFKFTKFTPFF
jgi:hypothetical protein